VRSQRVEREFVPYAYDWPVATRCGGQHRTGFSPHYRAQRRSRIETFHQTESRAGKELTRAHRTLDGFRASVGDEAIDERGENEV
jgi:hypothetical protein